MAVLDYEPKPARQRQERLLSPKYPGPYGLRYLLWPFACCLPTLVIWAAMRSDDAGLITLGCMAWLLMLPTHLLGAVLSVRVLLYSLKRPRDYWAALICVIPLGANCYFIFYWIELLFDWL
jgi:hypothetical protein